ncbi:MAG: hypothetical protein KTR15_15320 [Phycisphaeraceae bacterium]|nr:hypothetical protein [Phycisphaeraceae bacterium]
MASQHPIYDHLQRDSQRRIPRRDAGGGVIPPPKVPQTRNTSSYPDQTRPAAEPIAPRPTWIRRALRKLRLRRNDQTTQDNPPTTVQPVADGAVTPGKAGAPSRQAERLLSVAQRLWLRYESAGRLQSRAGHATQGYVDILTATLGEPKLPDEAFARLRWGGVFLYVGTNEKSVRNLAEAYDDKRGFILEEPVTQIHANVMGLRLPGLTPTGYAFLARKTQLIQPGDFTERFTYHVELTPCPVSDLAPDGYVVTKRVPTYADLVRRLRHKFPEVKLSDLEKRAHKLVEHVFPTFLTREAAMLGILQKNLAPQYRDRVPKPMGIQKDSRGFVRTLHMNWMRIGGEPISQLDFAIQSAELLSAIHEQANIMHLDLRMDNMVITPGGVGFVDFGSACKIGEQVQKSPMLGTLFTEMMRTSQIQRMLGKMIERGHVTNNAISEVYGKTDKTVDSFYLAVQIAKPHANPELKQLIDYDPESDTAGMLSALTAAVLRPKNPEMAQYKSANDLVRGLRRIERRARKPR